MGGKAGRGVEDRLYAKSQTNTIIDSELPIQLNPLYIGITFCVSKFPDLLKGTIKKEQSHRAQWINRCKAAPRGQIGWRQGEGVGWVQQEEVIEEPSLSQSLPLGDLPEYSLMVVDLESAFGSPTGRLVFSWRGKK